MFEFLNKYDDMSVFGVWLCSENISSAIEKLSNDIGFGFAEQRKKTINERIITCEIYKSTTDDRSFLMSVECTTVEPFYYLFIKCKLSLKDQIFNCIDEYLQEMEDWGIDKRNVDEYTDFLSDPLNEHNWFLTDLIDFGFIDGI